MGTLNLTGTVYNAPGITLSIVLYDASYNVVWSFYPTGNFIQNVPVNPGDYTLDIMGYTQGSFVLGLSGYTSIGHAPPGQYDLRVSDAFTLAF